MSYKYTDENRAHLHTLDDRPLVGTSTACKIIAKPLTWWAAGMAVGKLGWLNPKKFSAEQCYAAAEKALSKIKSLEVRGFLALLKEGYYAHNEKKEESAIEGTNLHAELEAFVKSEMGEKPLFEAWSEKIQPFIAWSRENVEKWLWSEAHCFSRELWVGGICDAGAKLKDGKIAVFDFKSSREAYFDQFVQAGGYALQILENGLYDAEGNKTGEVERIDALYIVPFGAEKVEPIANYDVEGYQAGFKSALGLYKLSEGYNAK
jgi:hypothetical protein